MFCHLKQSKQDANRAYDNYRQDCLIDSDTVCHMNTLIDAQQTIDRNITDTCDEHMTNQRVHGTCKLKDKRSDVSVGNSLDIHCQELIKN